MKKPKVTKNIEPFDRSNQYPFVNNQGETIYLDGHLTMEDLVKLGVKNIKFERPDKPLVNGWFAHTPTTKKTEKK